MKTSMRKAWSKYIFFSIIFNSGVCINICSWCFSTSAWSNFIQSINFSNTSLAIDKCSTSVAKASWSSFTYNIYPWLILPLTETICSPTYIKYFRLISFENCTIYCPYVYVLLRENVFQTKPPTNYIELTSKSSDSMLWNVPAEEGWFSERNSEVGSFTGSETRPWDRAQWHVC